MSDVIQCTVDTGVMLIRINREESRNALTHSMYFRMNDAIREAEESPSIRATLIHGSETSFCAGNDIMDFMQHPPLEDDAPVFRFMEAISKARKPLLAAVNGPAIGIGTTLLLHCDLVYAGDNAILQMPFANLALCPEAGSSLLIPQMIGHRKAAELLLLGEKMDAQQALELGFVNRVTAPDQSLPLALKSAQKMAAMAPDAICLSKQLMKEHQAGQLEQVIKREGAAFAERLRSAEAKEAFSAFLQKRPADFSRVE
ncbi:enoyl-CoA hydratase [Aestuariirhabdus litorea]|uniref:Enoyl-CoA hydratase n=1 Tax=Aestuariirhabdus litorea TaxID=2528527 RepID=A0A3P3VPN6_9GAMM|nr:enoyl-CoA hydratase [Aestuariirhabdus litorea]RRJ83878.1 enoyl-CoA hydratase [Aestuariirhabdus litorea]RWW97100.1 enoyl-CoA hydratase [Endozoicomonadaceae bacterium GTF-13]